MSEDKPYYHAAEDEDLDTSPPIVETEVVSRTRRYPDRPLRNARTAAFLGLLMIAASIIAGVYQVIFLPDANLSELVATSASGCLIGATLALPGFWKIRNNNLRARGGTPNQKHWFLITGLCVILFTAGLFIYPGPMIADGSATSTTAPSP